MKQISIIQHNVSKEGGTEKYWYYLLHGLKGRYDIRVFGWQLDDGLKNELKFTKIPSITAPTLLRFLSELLCNTVYRAIMKVKNEEAGITHCSGPDVFDPDICTAHVCQQGRLKAINKINLVRKNSTGNFLRKIHFGLLLGMTAFLERLIYNRKGTRRVICVSEKIKDELSRFYRIPDEKLIVIPDGVDTKAFNEDVRKNLRDENRKRLGFERDDFVMSFITSDWERKGFYTLLKALSFIDRTDIKLLAVGCSKRDFGIYSRIAQDLKIAQRVVFKPFELKIENYYSATDLLVHPSYYDSFGLVPLECMAMGIPALVSKDTGISEWIEDGKNGFIFNDPSDEKELSDKIREIISRNDLSKIRDNAVNIAKELSWEIVVRETAKIYEEVLKEKISH